MQITQKDIGEKMPYTQAGGHRLFGRSGLPPPTVPPAVWHFAVCVLPKAIVLPFGSAFYLLVGVSFKNYIQVIAYAQSICYFKLMKIVSFFAGAGGLDLGFEKAGFNTVWANEYDKTIWATYERNFPKAKLDRRSITDVPHNEIPDCDGMIGGPPCQSWSEAGAGRGINDERGKLFLDYIRLLEAKQPKFFLVENVAGMLNSKHAGAFNDFLKEFEKAGYNVSWKLVDANDFNVPQNRLRVIIVGYRKDLT